VYGSSLYSRVKVWIIRKSNYVNSQLNLDHALYLCNIRNIGTIIFGVWEYYVTLYDTSSGLTDRSPDL
jgi:hypothetical protein